MEKWKVALILLLLVALGSYGFFQQNGSHTSDDPTAQQNVPTPPQGNQKLLKLQGQAPPAWDIAAPLWVNTPRPITVANLKGHVALIEFWRMECSHCQDAAPHINQLFKKYSSRGVKFVAIHSPGPPGADNPENDWNKVQARIKEWGLHYPIAFDKGGTLYKNTYGGDTYPTMLIVDRKGKIAYINTGFTPEKEIELTKALEGILKKP